MRGTRTARRGSARARRGTHLEHFVEGALVDVGRNARDELCVDGLDDIAARAAAADAPRPRAQARREALHLGFHLALRGACAPAGCCAAGRYGGGGTDFRPPFDYVYENEIEVDSFIYLTDLECSMPDEPDYPVLWVSTTARTADFGKTIHLN